jgi:hypothetical protein
LSDEDECLYIVQTARAKFLIAHFCTLIWSNRILNLWSQKYNKYLNAKSSFWYKSKHRDQLQKFGPGPGPGPGPAK